MSKVGHTKGYIQVLVAAPDSFLGTSAMVKIISVGRWSVFGEVIETLNHISDDKASSKKMPDEVASSLCNNSPRTDKCSEEAESCSCGYSSCCSQSTTNKSSVVSGDATLPQNQYSGNFIGWILRKRKHLHKRAESEHALGSIEKQEGNHGSMREWSFVDKALLGGIFISLTIIVVAVALTFRVI